MTALARPRTILLDTQSATEIVNDERKIYRHEVKGMQREKQTLLTGQPYNNAALLTANIIMAGLFFYVTSLNAGDVLPPEVVWAQPLVGIVCGLAAGCLMYAINAIAYKLPTIKDRKTAVMMWSAWIAMLIVSAITSAFIALLLVNGADSKVDGARMSMKQAAQVAGVETAAVATATRQLEIWSENAANARKDRSSAADRIEQAETDYKAWQRDTMARFGQGSADGNRRLRDPAHYEHKPHLDAIASAKADLATAKTAIATADARVAEWESKLATAQATQRAALDRSTDTTTTEMSPWEETMEDMAAMLKIFGLRFESGSQFKASFAVFFALVVTLAPPFWSYQTGASVAPEVDAQAQRMSEIDQLAVEARQSFRGGSTPRLGGTATGGGAGGFAAPAPSAVSGAGGEGDAPMATSERASMGSMVDLALGIADPDPMLPCGLSQSRFDKLYSLNYDKVLKLLQDADNRMLSRTGEIALKKRYGGADDVAKMLKHVLFVEGYGEYAADGSISLFNPGEETA